MIIILFFLGLFLLAQYSILPSFLSQGAWKLHHFCLQSLPRGLENQESLEALVCGKKLQNEATLAVLHQTSLVQLFLISGIQFYFLHKIFAKLFKNRTVPLVLLFVYGLMTLFPPAALRVFCSLTWQEISRRFKLFISPMAVIFFAAACCLLCHPSWLHSQAFLLSLWAAILLTGSREYLGPQTPFLQKLFWGQCVLFAGFSLWGRAPEHPVNIVIHMMALPLTSFVLWPLAWLSVLLPSASPFFDKVSDFYLQAARHTLELFPESLPPAPSPPSWFWQWLLFLGVWFLTLILLIWRRRRQLQDE